MNNLPEDLNPPTSPEQLQRTLENGETVMAYGDAKIGCTVWEHMNNVDMLGPDWETYDIKSERFVLDWDDTCKDTGKHWVEAHREVLQSFGFDEESTTDDAILALFGNIHVADTLGLDKFVKDDKKFSDEEVWGLIKGRARELLAVNPMDPLLIEALKVAKQMGAHLAVWSSSPREILLEAIQQNGLEDLFDTVVSVDDVDPDKHKPNPQGLLMAVKAMDIARGYLQPDEDYSDTKPLMMNGVWMVGDSPNDVLGGKQAGASTVWLENPLQGHNAHEKRKATVERVARAAGKPAVHATIHDLSPTVTIRTFDPEEAGYARNVSMMDLAPEIVRALTTVNVNFAKFLIDRELRYQLYRSEHVRAALEEQGAMMIEPAEGLDAIFYGHTTTTARMIPKRQVVTAQTAEEAKQALERIAAKREQGALI